MPCKKCPAGYRIVRYRSGYPARCGIRCTPSTNEYRMWVTSRNILSWIQYLTLSHPEALHWWVKLSGVRQSKITKCPLLVALGRKGLMLSLLEAFSWQVKLPRIRQSEIITGMVSAGLEEKGFRNGWWFDVLHSAMDAHRKLGEHRNV